MDSPSPQKKLGIKTLYHIENNLELHKYLRHIYGQDITIHNHDSTVGAHNLPRTSIIAGGDPCQPNSNSGLRKGKADHRYRWPEMFRGIRELRPNWIINENVTGSISNMVLDQKISDLESIGYTCRPYVIPAVACGAHHRRDRVWLVAHANVQGRLQLVHTDPHQLFEESAQAVSLGAQGNPFLQFEERTGEPAILPVSHGIPDQITRLGLVGNSIVHQIPLILFQSIIAIEAVHPSHHS